MKKQILTIALILIVLGFFVWAYRRFLWFPHAVVTGVDGTGITWSNRDTILESRLLRGGTGSEGGTYGAGYMYEVQRLPNNQFRFIVYKSGQKNSPKVDNIFSFDAPPTYLTK